MALYFASAVGFGAEGSGVIGVHFPPYIRYAVCTDIAPKVEQISAAFERAAVKY